jgi:hypothetical protein
MSFTKVQDNSISTPEYVREFKGYLHSNIVVFHRLIDLIGEVSEDRPDLNFNWWLPLAENRLEKEINPLLGSII